MATLYLEYEVDGFSIVEKDKNSTDVYPLCQGCGTEQAGFIHYLDGHPPEYYCKDCTAFAIKALSVFVLRHHAEEMEKQKEN